MAMTKVLEQLQYKTSKTKTPSRGREMMRGKTMSYIFKVKQAVEASNEAIRRKIQNLLPPPKPKLKEAVLHIVLAPEFTHSI